MQYRLQDICLLTLERIYNSSSSFLTCWLTIDGAMAAFSLGQLTAEAARCGTSPYVLNCEYPPPWDWSPIEDISAWYTQKVWNVNGCFPGNPEWGEKKVWILSDCVISSGDPCENKDFCLKTLKFQGFILQQQPKKAEVQSHLYEGGQSFSGIA